MKKLRVHIYAMLGLFLLTFILGSFFDLSISQALFNRNDGFGLTVSVIGTIPGYGCFAVLAGIIVIYLLESDFKKYIKILGFIAAVAFFGLGIFFAGREFFGPNGFTNAKLNWLGYLIAAVVMSGLAYLGYRLGKGSENKKLWILILVMALAYFFALIPGVTALKAIFHRPRFRTITLEGATDIVFHNWWERCKNYQQLINEWNSLHPEQLITSEEFKSFPSGHAGASAIFILSVGFLPLLKEKYAKLQVPLLYVGLMWVLLVCYARIRVGAHFLSDVSMGALLTLIFFLIANEVMIRINKKLEKQAE